MRFRSLAIAAALLASVVVPTTAQAAAGSPARADWLGTLNAYRATAGLPAVTAQPDWVDGATLHANYMLATDEISHGEDASHPDFTPQGDEAGRRGNVAMVWGDAPADARRFLDMWMAGPFHAAGVLDPRLTRSAYAQATRSDDRVATAAVLDVIRGLDLHRAGAEAPVVWPGDGSGVPLDRYTGGEWPDPLTACSGYTAPTGLPIVIQFPTDTRVSSHRLVADGRNLEHCVFDAGTYTNPDAGIQQHAVEGLDARNVVVVVPRVPLPTGADITVEVTSDGVTAASTFRVTDGAFLPAGSVQPAASQRPAPQPSPFAAACPDATIERGRFVDVAPDASHAPGVDCVAAWAIARGRSADRFAPARAVTRAQMASFLVRLADAAGRPLPTGRSPFADTADSAHAAAVGTLAAAAVVDGTGAGRYDPDRAVTRGQMASFLDRMWPRLTGEALPAGLDAFADDDRSRHHDAINRVSAAGIAQGVDTQSFHPGGPVTRGQMATFLARVVDHLAEQGIASPPA